MSETSGRASLKEKKTALLLDYRAAFLRLMDMHKDEFGDPPCVAWAELRMEIASRDDLVFRIDGSGA